MLTKAQKAEQAALDKAEITAYLRVQRSNNPDADKPVTQGELYAMLTLSSDKLIAAMKKANNRIKNLEVQVADLEQECARIKRRSKRNG